MANPGSYVLTRFAADTRREVSRLQAQTDLFWQQELELYVAAGLRDGMAVLDAGCGPGHVVAKLRAAFPALNCTGVEVDPLLAGQAREFLEGQPGVRVLHQSIEHLGLPDASFDFALVRLVLEHLPEPALALAEIRRVLKPGGVIVAIDNDFDFHERTLPDCPGLAAVYAAYRRARRAEGGNPCIGRELPGLLKAAGLHAVSFQVLAAHSEITGDTPFLRAEGAGIPARLVQDGYLLPEALDSVSREWTAMLKTPGHAILRTLFVSSGKKLATAPAGETPRSSELPASELSSPSRSGLPSGTIPTTSAAIREFLLNTLAEEMPCRRDALETEASLLNLGLDSIAAVGLCNRVQTCLGIALPISEVLCGSSVHKLTERLLELTQNRGSEDVPSHRPITAQPRG